MVSVVALRTGRRGHCLQVVGVQVALQVEVSQHLTILHAEQALQLGIRGNGVLVLQVVELHVGSDRLGHVGARLLGAIAQSQEGAQLVRQRRRQLKDRGLPRLHLLTLNGLLGLAAALVSLLLKLGHALLQALQLSHQSASGLTHGSGLHQHCLHVILHRHYGGLRRLSGSSHHAVCNHRGALHNHRGALHCRSGLLLGALGSLLCSSRRSHSRSGHGCHYRLRGSSLLGNTLSGLRSNGSRTHYTRCRGSIHGGNTHIVCKTHSILDQCV